MSLYCRNFAAVATQIEISLQEETREKKKQPSARGGHHFQDSWQILVLLFGTEGIIMVGAKN